MGVLKYYSITAARALLPTKSFRTLRQIRDRMVASRRRLIDDRTRRLHGTLSLPRLVDSLRDLGLRSGVPVLVQSSYDSLNNLEGTPLELLDALYEATGTSATILMPVHTHYPVGKPGVFDALRTPSATGILTEMFRRDDGVVRSLHPTHSVCARGPLAHELTREHLQGVLSAGPQSPYAKLEHHDGMMIGIGLPFGFTTLYHVVEDEALERFPFRMYGKEPRTFQVIDVEGKVHEVAIPLRQDKVLSRINLPGIVRHLTASAMRQQLVCGIPIFVIDCSVFLKEVRRLRDNGITVYGAA